jgi:hypothetical protein
LKNCRSNEGGKTGLEEALGFEEVEEIRVWKKTCADRRSSRFTDLKKENKRKKKEEEEEEEEKKRKQNINK